jgi:1-deoxy-D-xylulose-5-phosphate reductoisomerase
LAGEWHNPIEKIILTASGGPFRGKTRDEIAAVSLEQALKHPNWSMGAKITIDSATLMNKGLEVIEAKWLFNLKPEQVEVVVHPQSILHSFVQFTDGSIKAQMGLPDMKLPILYALAYPNRLETNFPRFDFSSFPQLTFQQPDTETFGCLRLAIQAMKQGGNAPCILNAANEIAVEAFLEKRIRFLGIERIVEECLQRIPYSTPQYLEDFIEADAQTRNFARTLIV